MSKYLFFVLFFLSFFQNSLNAGCRDPYITFSYSKKYFSLLNKPIKGVLLIETVEQTDSIRIFTAFDGARGQFIEYLTIIFNNDTVFKLKEPVRYGKWPYIVLSMQEGQFQIFGRVKACEGFFENKSDFEIRFKPKEPIDLEDTIITKPVILTDSTNFDNLPDFSIEMDGIDSKWFNFSSKNEAIKFVSVYSLFGRLLQKVEINAKNARIPFDNLPTGICVVRITTESDKLHIKKILIP